MIKEEIGQREKMDLQNHVVQDVGSSDASRSFDKMNLLNKVEDYQFSSKSDGEDSNSDGSVNLSDESEKLRVKIEQKQQELI